MDRRRLTGKAIELAGVVSATALLVLALGWPIERLVPIALAFVAVKIYDAVRDRYDLNPGWSKTILGVALAVLGVVALFRPGGLLWIKFGFLVAGAWLALDGTFDLRVGAEPRRTGNAYVTVQDGGTIWRSLDADPKSAEELYDAVDLPDDRIEQALEELERQGRIEEANGVYRTSTPDRDWTSVPDRIFDRLLRPFGQF
ncbi:hypothetical protein SAMN06269185_2726 [Natronoarchaeum philippinense]|uniref:Uncharacterized protein n=1 Tax=Natronoarchaeum philippinense TaxID=558529 RepID=A0A285P399_NATPI|nr:hypothetical protein [Natronoarchaeum philippinense]SNZ16212.1 hypothetical protein SAMN06269185_2726 [Natronoarchaeum philippinense]